MWAWRVVSILGVVQFRSESHYREAVVRAALKTWRQGYHAFSNAYDPLRRSPVTYVYTPRLQSAPSSRILASLAALKMYQALSGDKVIWVRCILRNEQHPRFDREFASTLKSEGARIVPFI